MQHTDIKPMTSAEWALVVNAIPGLGDLVDPEVAKRHVQLLEFEAGSSLPPTGMYIVLAGSSVLSSNGEQVAVADKGNYFYEEYLVLKDTPVALEARIGSGGARLAFVDNAGWDELPESVRTSCLDSLFGDLVNAQIHDLHLRGSVMTAGFHPEPMVDAERLNRQLEPLHDATARLLLSALLPAIHVAWADGQVQEGERRAILTLADNLGLTEAKPRARLAQWLRSPPDRAEVAAALRMLGDPAHAKGARQTALAPLKWAEAIARADGGVLGIGAISAEEQHALDGLADDLPVESFTRRSLRTLSTLSALVSAALSSTDRRHDVAPPTQPSPLPVPAPRDPDRMPPAVFGVPESDYRPYMEILIPRYVRTLREDWLEVLNVAGASPGVAPMDDQELSRLVGETPFSRFLTPTLDPVDYERFSADIDGGFDGALYKVDLSHFAGWRTLPGLHVAPTVGLFCARGDALEPRAIAVGERVFRPTDGESWARARYFLIQGCSVALVVGMHPFLHFPMDSVIAVTRCTLPARHRIAKLIEAHAYLHLPLNYGVRGNPRSAAHNDQREIYTTLPADGDQIFQGMADCFAGITGNSAYPGFRYPMRAPTIHGSYGRFLSQYYEVLLEHCQTVVNAGGWEPVLGDWGAQLHDLLPGFPEAEALQNPETLARALAGFVHAVSVWHSAEHYAYAQEPVTRVPQRLRVPPPTGRDAPIPRSAWLFPVDIARQELSRRMFYEAHTVRPLLDVRYAFDEPALAGATGALIDALHACDGRVERRYIPLERIACSLQF